MFFTLVLDVVEMSGIEKDCGRSDELARIEVVGAVIALAPASPSFLFRSRLRRKNLFRTQWRTPISFLGKKTMTKG
ncbi:uncharacterized protein LOC132315730 isoform X10 [Cornus florida]|uniref:uncharacterized protein LOC132315730 isoform X10 n=1 Tax=Cornus florida TaxID=4283 RepID=UPI00289EA87B|nr:uncharacterized protein LOC132315730 isoform X10 [Cornus florida]